MDTAKAGPRSAQVFRFRQSDALVRNVMENAAVGMALLSPGGKLIYVNQAYAAMLRYAPDECIGLGVENLVRDEDLQSASRDLERLIRGDIDSYRAERQFKRSDGTTFWGLVSDIGATGRTNAPAHLCHCPDHRHRRAEASRGRACRE